MRKREYLGSMPWAICYLDTQYSLPRRSIAYNGNRPNRSGTKVKKEKPPILSVQRVVVPRDGWIGWMDGDQDMHAATFYTGQGTLPNAHLPVKVPIAAPPPLPSLLPPSYWGGEEHEHEEERRAVCLRSICMCIKALASQPLFGV